VQAQQHTFPKISIITPSYNQGRFLEETILSVLDQNYPNLEYILIDGGSTDNSIDIIKKYEKQIAYWISEKDSGQSEAINKGYKKATGEIIAWLNSDDLYTKNTLHEIADHFVKHPEADIVYGDVINFLENGKELYVDNQFDLQDFFSRISIHQPSVFWRREILQNSALLDEELFYCMDYDLWMKLFLNFKSLKIKKIFSRFREHSDSKTHTRPLDLYTEYQCLVSRFFNSLPGTEWKAKLQKSGIQYDLSSKTYTLKNTYSTNTLDALFETFLQKSLDIEYTKGNFRKVNGLFLKNPRLFLNKKSLLIFLKINSLFFLFRERLTSLERARNLSAYK
jgi:glycosyltransferase involved in cell wall biosynthesis